MKSLLTIGLLALSLSAQSQVLIYKNALTRTLTGGGTTAKTLVSGWTVINMTNGAVTRIEAVKATKTFKVYSIIGTVTLPRGNAGKEYTVFAMTETGQNADGFDVHNSETIKGANVTVDIGLPVNNGSVPRSMQFMGRSSYSVAAGDYIQETTGTLTIALKDTSQANVMQMAFADVVQAGRNSLTESGYTDTTPQ